MRLTSKLTVAVGLAMFFVLATSGFLRARAEVAAYERDITRDHDTMSRVVSEALEHLAAREGRARARELVEDLNERDARLEITWLDSPPPSPRTHSSVEVIAGERFLVTHTPMLDRAGTPSTLRVVEALSDEDALVVASYLRAAVAALALALVCTLVMLALGTVLVARPLGALGALARRVGAGDLSARAEVGSDEIGDLGRELNGMTAALFQTQARLDEAQGARVAILEQLRHADRLRVVGEISSEVAHQIGTPLSAVRVRAQLLAQGEITEPRIPETARKIVDDVDRVSAIVRRLLDFARRPTGKRQSVDAATWADATLDILRPLASKQGVALALSVPADRVEVTIDAIEMQQAVTNLVMNALQSSRSGAKIEVRVEAEPSALSIHVQDHGAGIAPDALGHVFEPYFTTKAVGEGTGLGLSVAHGIVREHGGTIDLESEIGVGTTVSIHLPRTAKASRADGKASWTARPRRPE